MCRTPPRERVRVSLTEPGSSMNDMNSPIRGNRPRLSVQVSDTQFPHELLNTGMPERHPGPASGRYGRETADSARVISFLPTFSGRW